MRKFLEFILKRLGVSLEQIPYSAWHSKVFYLYRKDKWRHTASAVRSVPFLNSEVYFQSNDFRAYLPKTINEEIVRIGALAQSAAAIKEFDFYDIGTNYGLYSIPIYEGRKELKVGSIVQVEPNPFLCFCLARTFGKDAKLYKTAIGAKSTTEEVEIAIKPSGSGASSLSARAAVAPFQDFMLDTVALPIDLILRENKVREKAVVKIDVEGLERDLLENNLLQKLSEQYCDFVLFIEYLKTEDEHCNEEFLEYFDSHWCMVFTRDQWLANEKVALDPGANILDLNISSFYKVSLEKGIRNLISKSAAEADILVFSSREIALNVTSSMKLQSETSC